MVNIFFSENRALYEIMWKNRVELDATDENTGHVQCILDT